MIKVSISGSKFLKLTHKQTEGRIVGALVVLPVQTVTYIEETLVDPHIVCCVFICLLLLIKKLTVNPEPCYLFISSVIIFRLLGNSCDPLFSLRPTGQEGQEQSPYQRQTGGEHADCCRYKNKTG